MDISIQNELEYRFNFLSSLFFSFIPFTVNLLIWFSISDYSESKFGFSLKGIVSYYFIILIVDIITSSNLQWRIADDIKTGNVNKYLIKTVDYMIFNLFLDIPKRLIYIIFGFIPVSIIGFLLRNYIEIYLSLENVICFVLALAIGYLINFLLTFIISICSFYFSEVTNLFTSYNVLRNIVSGKIFPLSILPKFVYQVLIIAPFQYISFFPSMLLLNKFTQKEIVVNLLVGFLWTVLLYILSRVIWKKGLEKYSAFGG